MKALISVIALFVFSIPASADTVLSSDFVVKVSPYSVNKTMNNFEAIVKKKGFGVFVRINHRKNAQGVGLEMNPSQVLIFGKPKGGTLLMKQDIAVSLDLPLRVAVYKADNGKVYIAYHAPIPMVSAYNLTGHKVLNKLTAGLDKLTSAAIK